jgi:CRISPR-associated endonuclease/helicase Cas3
MDIGFKNISLIDSDEQLAGRINRNVNKKNCELFIFRYNEPSKLFDEDQRYKQTKENINREQYQEILRTKDFDKLYNMVLEYIDNWNEKTMAIGFNNYVDEIKMLNFKSVSDKFKLIKQENISIFIPMAVPIVVDGIHENSEDMIFSKSELQFLASANILPNEKNKIEGEKVFDLYLDLIHNRKTDFIEQKVRYMILSGIMSKFIISIFNNKWDTTILKYINIEKSQYGYLYLESYSIIYNEQMGLNLENNHAVII